MIAEPPYRQFVVVQLDSYADRYSVLRQGAADLCYHVMAECSSKCDADFIAESLSIRYGYTP